MDTAIVGLAAPLQLIALAIALIMAILVGIRVFAQGAKGYSLLIGEVAGFLIALYIVGRPNDVLGILLKAVGGIQTPTALH